MIDSRAEQCAALKAASELAGELFHATNGRDFRHVFTQHFKVFKQDGPFVIQRWPEDLAAVNFVFDLAKDPGVGHRSATNQQAVAAGFAKTIERLFDSRDITATRDWNAHCFFDLLYEIPIRQAAIALFFRATVQSNVLS